ncbi:hypothetical protein [Vibrio phage V-YDF132]|nr:hypothetical protein [Vibrio phage V-YDF132]
MTTILQLIAPAFVAIPLASLIGVVTVWSVRGLFRMIFDVWLDLRLKELDIIALQYGCIDYGYYFQLRTELQDSVRERGTFESWAQYHYLRDIAWGSYEQESKDCH